MAKVAKKTEELEVSENLTISKAHKDEFVLAVGRRKEAVARVRLYAKSESVSWDGLEAKKGDILVNGKTADVYFPGTVAKAIYSEPLRATNLLGKVIITARVQGGGPAGQLGAVVHGIARALNLLDVTVNRPILKKRGFMTRDARTRQRRSVGMGGKSRRKKQSPKR